MFHNHYGSKTKKVKCDFPNTPKGLVSVINNVGTVHKILPLNKIKISIAYKNFHDIKLKMDLDLIK